MTNNKDKFSAVDAYMVMHHPILIFYLFMHLRPVF